MWLVGLRLLPYLVGVSALAGVTWFIYDSGFDRGVEKTSKQYEIRINLERERLAEANREALRQAQEKVATLEASLEARNAEIRLLLSEAASDPNANNDALGADSVRRINNIGGAANTTNGPR